MKLTDITNNKAKEIIEGAPKEATHFSCIEGKTQYYKNETVISSLDEVFINVFRDIFQPNVFLLSDLENQMNIDKFETQTPEELHPDPKQGEVWRCILLPRQYVIYLYKAHNEWDTDWVNAELLEGQTIKPIQKLYTQSEVEAMPNAVATEHQEEMRAFSGEIACKVIVEHVKWNFECAWHAIKVFEDGEKLYTKKSDSEFVLIDNAPDVLRYLYSIYERIERDETPQQREDRERLERVNAMPKMDLEKWFWEVDAVDKSNEYRLGVKGVLGRFEQSIKILLDKTNYRKGLK